MSSSAHNLPRLLHTILNSFIDLCECDGGSVYTLRKDAKGEPVLVFETMVTRSIKLYEVPEHLRNLSFKIDDASLVGRTARQRKFFKVATPPTDAQSGSKKVDSALNYSTRNMLSGPLITPRGDLVGVVQLLNKFPREGTGETEATADFDARDERLLSIVAGQAALAIENSMLLDEQEKLLEGFVNACVTAVESRDPVTSGHSTRVSDYTIGLTEAVNRTQSGPLGKLSFSEAQIREIRYAAMLHDIGKIAVREEVLNKEKKLTRWELELVRMRLKLMRSELKRLGPAGAGSVVDVQEMLGKIDQAWKMIVDANEPTVLPAAVGGFLKDLEKIRVMTDDGDALAALTEEESFKLSIPKGSLTQGERQEIERHVSNTFEILKMVPWSRGLEHVPEIAHKHHEKLDGTGYPLRAKAAEIPVQSRMLAICDIYDALTADDRPYKRAVPVEKALDILGSEVKAKKLDADLFQVFVDARVYEAVKREQKKKAA